MWFIQRPSISCPIGVSNPLFSVKMKAKPVFLLLFFQEFIVTAVTIEKDLAKTNRLLSEAEARAAEVFKEVQEQGVSKEEEAEDYLCGTYDESYF